jgi:hypothetical protein
LVFETLEKDAVMGEITVFCNLLNFVSWNWGSIAEWLTIVAELVVAYVIYLEVEHSRQANYFEKATQAGANKDRGIIYEAFVRLGPESMPLKDRRKEFFDLIHAKPDIRECCDSQIRLINELGFTATRTLASKKDFVALFPHGPIFLWYIAGPYIEERAGDTGPWYARHLMVFTQDCIEYIREKKPTLALRSFDGSVRIPVLPKDLDLIGDELRILLKKLGPPPTP